MTVTVDSPGTGADRASDRAYARLRQEIVDWQLQPGTVLGEVEQAQRLGLSRTPLREALSRLVADGLASQQRGRGVVVTDVSLEHLDHLFELRAALETTAARAAARAVRAGTARAAEFESLTRRLVEAAHNGTSADPSLTVTGGPAEAVPSAHARFYVLASELDAAIDAAAANPYLEQALRQLRVHLQRIRRLARDHHERLRASALEHAAIARAIAAGQPSVAASATELHLFHSRQHIAASS